MCTSTIETSILLLLCVMMCCTTVSAVVYPQTYVLGEFTLTKCFTDSGIDGIYCYNHTVPLDWDTSNIPHIPKIKVAFFVHIAEQQVGLPPGRHRVSFFPSGGPGTTTHLVVPRMLSMISVYANVFSSNDVVMVDQRGMGFSCGMSCSNAWVGYAATRFSGSNIDQLAEIGRKFHSDCISEILTSKEQASTSDECIVGSNLDPRIQRAALANFMGTSQAVRDAHDFIRRAGYRSVALIGISYGSYVVQAYASMFPNHVRSMIVDSGFDTLVSGGQRSSRALAGRRSGLARLAEMCSADPACASDAACVLPGTSECTGAVLAKFERVLNCSTWPRRVRYPYVDPNSGGVEMIDVSLDSWWMGAYLDNYVASTARAAFSRALLRSAVQGDHTALARVAYGTYSIDPRDPSIPLEVMMGSGLAQISVYSIVTGADVMWRTKQLPLFVTPKELERQYLEAYGRHSLGDVLGISDPAYIQHSATFGNLLDPVFSVRSQNSTRHTPTIGYHSYNVLLLGPSRDMRAPGPDMDVLFDRFNSTGPTSRIVVNDGDHGVITLGLTRGFLDPGMLPVYAVVESALCEDAFPAPGEISKIQSAVTFPNYRSAKRAGRAPLRLVEDEFLMLPEFVFGTTSVAACDNGGFVAWPEMYNDTHLAVSFHGCAFDATHSVSGVAAYDVSDPASNFVLGGGISFDVAYVTDASNTRTTCYRYVHLAGRDPVQVEIQCPQPGVSNRHANTIPSGMRARKLPSHALF